MKDIKKIVDQCIDSNFGCEMKSFEKIGEGASGTVYLASFGKAPHIVAIKVGKNADMHDTLESEYNAAKYICENTSCNLAKPYFFYKEDEVALYAMKYVPGISAEGMKLWFKNRMKRIRLANVAVKNLMKLQKARNEKFGPIDNAVYDTWFEYYKDFAEGIYLFSKKQKESGNLSEFVFNAVETAYNNLDKIIDVPQAYPILETEEEAVDEENEADGEENSDNSIEEAAVAMDEIKPAVLAHGDYWVANFIIDPKTLALKSVIDPFEVKWAEPEYDLFGLTIGYGRMLNLLDNYKLRVKTSEYCDMKIELYALFNELRWYELNEKIDHNYLKMRSKKLMKLMKYHGII